MNDILSQIWQLPWYQVLWIAVVDDLILLVKMRYFWLASIAFLFGAGFWRTKNKQ